MMTCAHVSQRRTRVAALAVGLIAATAMAPAGSALAAGVAFQPARDIAVGPRPASLAVADFNLDGAPDLAVAGRMPAPDTPGGVSLRLGTGTGTFGPPVTLGLAGVRDPSSIAAGDFNRDGAPDLAVTDFDAALSSQSPVYGALLIGDGKGSFAASQVEVAYGIAYPVAAGTGDVDGDGTPDLVSVGVWPLSGGLDPLGFLSATLADGTGALPTRRTYVGGLVKRSVAVGDLDGDGNADVVTADSGREDFPGRVGVSWGDGSGEFGPDAGGVTGTDAGDGSASVALGDLDGNVTPDVVVANYTSDDVTVVLGNGTPTLTAGQAYAAHDGPRSVAVSDFDGDGRQDLAVANAVSGDVSVLLGTGSGAFASPVHLDAGEMVTLAGDRYFGDGGLLRVADLDCNGRPDILVANGVSGSVSVLMNAAPSPLPPGCQAQPPDTTGPAVRILSTSLRMTARGRVPVRLRCPAAEPAGCKATLRIRTKSQVRVSPTTTRIVVLAAATRQLEPGVTTRVRLTLSRANRALVRRVETVRVIVSVRALDQARNARTTKKTLMLRAP